MWKKQKPGAAKALARTIVRRQLGNHEDQEDKNQDTAARVAAVLAQVNSKNFTVLATAQSDSDGPDYQIRMGSNHAVFCTCKGWQFSKTGTCKHLERYKLQVRPILVTKGGR